WVVDSNGQLDKAKSYRDLIVSYKEGKAVRLHDVATVYDSVEDQYQAGFLNASPSVMVGIKRQAGANMLDTIDAIKAQLPELEKNLPADTALKVVVDRSPGVRASLYDTEETLLVAVLLVIAVVFVFLRNLQAVIIPALALPVSLIGTCAVMYLLGYSLDNLSLMALTIATGFVVDDAIVVLENISRHVEAGMKPLAAALKGVREVGFTVLSMSLSLVAVFLPLLMIGGLIGRFFAEFAITLSVAIVISLFISVTLTPMMCAYLLKPHAPRSQPRQRGFGRILMAIQQGYGRSLNLVLNHARWVLLLFFGTIALTVWLFISIPKTFMPEQDTGRLSGFISADQSISFQAMRSKLQDFMTIVGADPAVESVMSSMGSGMFGSRNSANFFVRLKDFDQRDATATEVANRLSMKTSHIAGAQMFLMAAQDLHIGGRSANATYQYSLQADDLDLLREWTPKVQAALAAIPQFNSVDSDSQTGGQEVVMNIDRDRATRLGVDVQMLDTLLNNAFSQRQIATLYH
ncbi:efflux RND transporter permease subunit, partial [Escherichia coli]|uniref:efflux RND transporter permease subunit n=1 Tax=Escherichia coli TaxID=562 RepID=UPI002DD44AE6